MKFLCSTILAITVSQATWAESKIVPSDDSCPISMDLSMEETGAFLMFNADLSHLYKYYGHENFQVNLNRIVAAEWPQRKVIEVSPTFMEKVLNLVDQANLRDSIASTIGLEAREWLDFEHTMRDVTLNGLLMYDRFGEFTKITQTLMTAIKTRNVVTRGISDKSANLLKARALTRIANMFIFIQRWDIINRDIIDLRASASGKTFMLRALGLTTGGLLVASTLYAGPIVAGAGALAASFSSDVVVAAQLARLGQIAAGGGLGLVGAPTALLLKNSTVSVLEAQRKAHNNGTVYACELDKQFEEWRRQGVSPYLKAALIGGSIGLGGGALTLTQTGAQTILWATSISVGVAQAYSLGKFGVDTMKALAEYQMAMAAHEAGKDLSKNNCYKYTISVVYFS